MEAPPVVSLGRLQTELNSLMADYERLSLQRTEQGCMSTFGIILTFIGGVAFLAGGFRFLPAWLFYLPILLGGLGLLRSAIRFWKRSPQRIAELDRRLADLASHAPIADRLSVGHESLKRLHSRLIECTSEVATSIIGILEVAGNKASVEYLRRIAGAGPFVGIVPVSPPALKHLAAKAAESLQKKLDRETNSVTLLRAGGSATEHELLRPVSPTGEQAPELLLRPTEED